MKKLDFKVLSLIFLSSIILFSTLPIVTSQQSNPIKITNSGNIYYPPINTNLPPPSNNNPSVYFGLSAYPKTPSGSYSTAVIDEVIQVMDLNNFNIYRMSFNPNVNPDQYVQYYLDNCNYDLIVDLWHFYPPGTLSDSEWEEIESSWISFCARFSQYQNRIICEIANERQDSDLPAQTQEIIDAIRSNGYTFKILMNKWEHSWNQMASINDPLDKFYVGYHYYFNYWSVSSAKREMTNALELNLKIINTETGADTNEYREYDQSEIDELNEFDTWCEENGIGNTIWTRYGLGNYQTYKDFGLLNPLTDQTLK